MLSKGSENRHPCDDETINLKRVSDNWIPVSKALYVCAFILAQGEYAINIANFGNYLNVQ